MSDVPAVRPGVWAARALPIDLIRPLAVVSSLALVAFVALGSSLAGRTSATGLDTSARSLPLDPSLALAVDALSEPAGAAMLSLTAVVVLLVLRRARSAALAALTPAVLGAGSTLIKPVVDRTIHGEFLSFPSGHTAGLTGFALVLALAVTSRVGSGRSAAARRLAAALVLLAGSIAGWAQFTLDAHYATDTAGGFLLALAMVPLLALLLDRCIDAVGERATRDQR